MVEGVCLSIFCVVSRRRPRNCCGDTRFEFDIRFESYLSDVAISAFEIELLQLLEFENCDYRVLNSLGDLIGVFEI